MKISAARADRFCANPDDGVKLVLIYGPNEGLVRLRADACARAVVDDLDDPFRVTTVDAGSLRDEPGRLADEAAAMSLIGGRRVVRVRDASEALVKAVESCLALEAVESLVVVEAGALTPRSGLRKLFEQNRSTAAVPCYEENADDVADVIERLCAAHGIDTEVEAVGWLAERVGADRGQVVSEVEKIATFLRSDETETATLTTEVAAACIGDAGGTSADAIARFATSGELESLDRAMARGFYAGVQPISVLRSAARRLLRLHRASADVEQGATAQQAMSALRPPVYPREQSAFAGEMARWSSDRAARALALVVEAERDCKVSTGSPEAISWHAMLRIGGAARASRAT